MIFHGWSIFALLFGYEIVTSFSFHRAISAPAVSRLRLSASVPSTADPPLSATVYDGPATDFSAVEVGCSIGEIGLDIMVGKSVVAPGRGLFVCLSEGVDECVLPQGTPLCGYSRGSLSHKSTGDKTVGYLFDSLDNHVVFNKKVVPLGDAVSAASKDGGDVRYVLQGHLLHLNNQKSDGNTNILVFPDPSWKKHCFIPDPVADEDLGGILNYGVFANDLGYSAGISREEYKRNADIHNIVMLAWRMEIVDSKLCPLWPVVVLRKDTKFTNTEPMEIGATYSWKYWDEIH